MRRTVELAHTTGQDVAILVASSLTMCCGGGWRAVTDEQRYTGRIAHLGDNHFVLHRGDLGRIMQVLVEYDNLLDVQIVQPTVD